MIDFNKAYVLLNVAQLANQWPNLAWLREAALKEIERLGQIPQERVTEKR